MKHIPARTLLAAAVASAMLAACGGSSDSTSQSGSGGTAAGVTGTFLDSAVEGLEYVAGSSAKAATNAKGEFTCKEGETVTFSIGGITLGSAPCGKTITPQTLAGAASMSDDKVVNRLMLLQLLDEDNDPSNGIKLAADVKTALASGATLDFTTAAGTFNTALTNVLGKLAEKYKGRSVDDDRRRLVREHFEDTLASRIGAPHADTVAQTNALGTVSTTITRYQMQAASNTYIPYEDNNSAIKTDFPLGFLPSYGSGLAFKGKNGNGDLEFYGLTDRGPNGDGPIVPAVAALNNVTGSKIFPSPSFSPSFGIITVGKNGAVLTSTTPIKASASIKTTGLPIPFGSIGNSAEVPVMDSLRFDASSKAVFDANGLDTEAIVVDKKRNALWVSDEYGTFIAKLDPVTGVILAKYAPESGLPSIFKKRRANRGMEGLALDTTTDKLHGFLQSPLSDGKAYYSVTKKNEDVEKFARFTRWIEFDPVSGTTTRMYAYPIEGAEYDKGRTGNAKLGDVVALGNGKFIVIEQGAGTDGKVFNNLVLVEIGNATDIGTAAFNPATSDLEKSSMGAVAVNGADWASVVPLKKTVLFNLNKAGWLAEKAEGLTVVDDFTLALANDNDFGLSTKIFDKDGKVVSGADITKCTVDANGALTTSAEVGCVAGNTARVARGSDSERPSRLWLIKFSKALSSFSVPAK